LRSDGTVMSWGINETGQLGSGSASPGFRPQPAPVVGLANVVAIACGSTQLSHGLALLADGTVRAWGRNGDGQLGDGSKNSALAPVVVTGLNLN
jgi:alpha-tubulin suppressor-like RCC1 family protein